MAGRFKKGETPKGAIPISEGIAKEMQARSVQARYAKKRGKELMIALLGERTKDPTVVASMRAAGYNPDEITNELALHLRQIEKAQKTGDTKAYKAIMKMAGYDEQTINLKGVAPIVAKDAEDAAKIQGLLDSVAARKNGGK